MKLLKVKKLLLLPLLLTAVLVTGCNISNPTDGLAVIVQTIPRETSINVTLKNLEGNAVFAPVTIFFEGKDSAKVISETKVKLTSLTTSSGVISFSILDGTVITAANPVKLNLRIRSVNNDYLEAEYPITLTAKGKFAFDFTIAKLSTLASSGVEYIANIATGSSASASGALSSEINYSSPRGVGLIVPVGTILKDKNGTPLSGNLSLSMTTINQRAGALFPYVTVTNTGSTFRTVASLSAVITDASGRVATSASPNPGTFSLPTDSIINPYTLLPFVQGDTLYNITTDANGVTTSQMILVTPQRGGMPPRFGPPFTPGSSNRIGTLPRFQGFNATVNGFLNLPGCVLVPRSQPAFGNQKVGEWAINSTVNSESISISNSQPDGSVAIYSIGGDIPLSNVEPYFGNRILTAKSDNLNLNIKVIGKCPNASNNPRFIEPNLPLTFRKQVGTEWVIAAVATLTNGRGMVTLPGNGLYKASGTYNNNFYEVEVTVSGGVLTFNNNNSNIERMSTSGSSGTNSFNLHYYILTTEACK